MKNIIFFDDEQWDHLLPLTYTKPICQLRTGILTIQEKWEKHLKLSSSYITQDYLSEKFPIHIKSDNLLINGGLLPTPKLLALIQDLELNEALLDGEELLVARLNNDQFEHLTNDEAIDELKGMDISNEEDTIVRIKRPHHLFEYAASELEKDFDLITSGRKSQKLSDTNRTLNPSRIFLEEGAKVEFATLNASTGSIYIGKNAEIMEGAMIRGGLGLCDHSVVKMGAKLYGANTIGPWSKVGGEVGNSVLLGYSNKGHDGYLGNSVLGEWCNLGADTNNSNLKNNYAEVKLWSYVENRFTKTGLQFCGLIMGDHSKCGINTMFNTGTVIGVSCNIYGDGFPRNFVPSFSWGGSSGFTTYKVEKAIEVGKIVMARRKIDLLDIDQKILKHIFLDSAKRRVWEKAV